MRWLKNQKFICQSSGDWEAQDQSASQFGYWWEPSSCLADSCPLAIYLHDLSLVHPEGRETERKKQRKKEISLLLLQGLQSYEIGTLPLWPHLNVICLLKALSPNTTILVVGISKHEFVGEYNSAYRLILTSFYLR